MEPYWVNLGHIVVAHFKKYHPGPCRFCLLALRKDQNLNPGCSNPSTQGAAQLGETNQPFHVEQIKGGQLLELLQVAEEPRHQVRLGEGDQHGPGPASRDEPGHVLELVFAARDEAHFGVHRDREVLLGARN